MAMTDSDGNGELGFTPEEITAIALQMLEAAKQAKVGDFIAISLSLEVGTHTASVNIRPQRTRMRQRIVTLALRPLGQHALL